MLHVILMASRIEIMPGFLENLLTFIREMPEYVKNVLKLNVTTEKQENISKFSN